MTRRARSRTTVTPTMVGQRDLTVHAETLDVPGADGPSGAILRPVGVQYDVGEELDAYGQELTLVEQADGVRASRGAQIRGAGLALRADAARRLVDLHEGEVRDAIQGHSQAQNDLQRFVRRRPKDNGRYRWTRWGLLWADAGAIFGALVFVGEQPILAAGTAIAVGLSAVTAGLLGGDVRELKLARERRALVDAEVVDADLVRAYPSLFSVPTRDRDTYGLALLWGLLALVFTAVGVFALRAALEGLLGVVFAGFAVAVGLASFISSWAHADPVADLLEVFAERMTRAISRHATLASAPQPAAQAAAEAEATSIRQESQLRGEAKATSARALKHAVYRRHPEVFGHGLAEYRVVRTRALPADERETRDPESAVPAGTSNRFLTNGHPPMDRSG